METGEYGTYGAGNLPATVKYYFANGQRIARQAGSSTLQYCHADHLGSAVMMTDKDAEIIMLTAWSPFGETLFDLNEITSFLFTGQEFDEGTGLYYYGALLQKTYVFFGLRQQAPPVAYGYYDPWLCRFISPDSVLDGLNRYAYYGNNPVNYTDPTGHLVYNGKG